MSLLGLFRGADEQRYAGDSWDIPWGSPMGGGVVNEDTAFNLSTVWACVTLIADAISTMPVDVYRKTADGRDPITAPSWVERPNPDMLKVEYDTQRLIQLLLTGDAVSVLVRRGGYSDPAAPVIERWPVPSHDVTVLRGADNRARYLVKGQDVPRGNIQHIRGYSRPGELRGMSVIEYARTTLGLGLSGDQLTETMLSNGLNPGGVLEVPAMPPETQAGVIERLRENFSKWYGGPRNAGKPMVLAGGTTWKQMSITPADAQFLDSRKFTIEEIARWFRVPLHEIQHIDKQSSWGSGIEQLSIGLVRRTLLPWMVRLEQADSALLPRPQFVKYNADAQVRADIKTRYEAHKMGREGGWLSANDVRTLEDLPPVDNGDIYLQPLNYVEAGTEPAQPDPPAAPPPDSAPVRDVTVNMGEIRVDPTINVPEPVVNVEAPPPPVVNVAAPVVNVEPPVVNVEPPVVNVESLGERGSEIVKKTVVRDAAGLITDVIERRVPITEDEED